MAHNAGLLQEIGDTYHESVENPEPPPEGGAQSKKKTAKETKESGGE